MKVYKTNGFMHVWVENNITHIYLREYREAGTIKLTESETSQLVEFLSNKTLVCPLCEETPTSCTCQNENLSP